ncbi:MAG: cytochrome d ubiquinol oxidase subunit II [Desulfobacterales bacterium]|nr:cytochrome d ubiquinol oxidase subunit II [Desulfobacterales bacterium]
MELQTIWFFVWGLLWAVFFMLDGFNFGIGSLMPFLAKKEMDKKIMVRAMGPFWDGNEVWLLTAGGVTFAAFPDVYAVMFSSLYAALMLVLFSLIVRGVGIEFRGKLDTPAWKRLWDTCIFIGSAAPAILFGVAFANIFRGIPFDGEGIYHGTLLTLLNPYGLLGGVLFLCLFLLHGANMLACKTKGVLHHSAVRTANRLWPVTLVVTVVFLIASWFATDLYDNYLASPVLFLFILLTALFLVGVKIFLVKNSFIKAWTASALTIVGATFFGIIGLFPNMFPSSINADFSLTAFNASSSPMTLKIMLGVVIIFVPAIIAYQSWAYRLFKDKITEESLAHEEGY